MFHNYGNKLQIYFLLQPNNYKNPRLFCDYFTNGNPGLLLQPIRREVLSLQPYVVLYHNFTTDSEAEKIKLLAQPGVCMDSELSFSITFKNIELKFRLNSSIIFYTSKINIHIDNN